MTHRGACSADNDSGDGAGALLGIPHQYYSTLLASAGLELPPPAQYGTGILFLDAETLAASQGRNGKNKSTLFIDDVRHQKPSKLLKQCFSVSAQTAFAALAEQQGIAVLHWREVRTEPACLGSVARTSMPVIVQVFVTPAQLGMRGEEFNRDNTATLIGDKTQTSSNLFKLVSHPVKTFIFILLPDHSCLCIALKETVCAAEACNAHHPPARHTLLYLLPLHHNHSLQGEKHLRF